MMFTKRNTDGLGSIRRRSSQRMGFTLIELLVVISIIALLMAILMPALNKAREQAYAIPCMSNMRTISLAFYMYQEDNDGKIAGGDAWFQPSNFGVGKRSYSWVACPLDENGNARRGEFANVEYERNGIRAGVLWDYIGEMEAYNCPSDNRAQRADIGWRSYSMVVGLDSEFVGHFPRDKSVTRFNEISSPSTSYITVEEDERHPDEDNNNPWWNMGSWVIDIENQRWFDPVAKWHSNGGNLGFADGHAERFKWKDERTVTWLENGGEKRVDHPGSYDMEYMLEHVAKKGK
ncbi:type II secretion system protein [Sedimentisphaera salicampi]|uniref:PilD-dependent protein PddA n=1 Tax=Sedimentisphaera salicampi TaxID=1941349 RepID=A0A1W6LKA1_9BACT|nr:type II secretion system protein [Sedimentisphaera salicampi]ARN56164.1 PilD-dependent protein PddA [Sedimentisphaera salicampi]OXU15742.1 PilD-dependent protein PddA [Sedimentisphaera salicampi]